MTIAEQPVTDDGCLRAHFSEAAQLDFGLAVAKRFGFDLQRGRLDKTAHPFCTKFAIGDVRITTRVRENDIGDALFSTLHEAGHALYEQGIDAKLEGTPLGYGCSAGRCCSQGRGGSRRHRLADQRPGADGGGRRRRAGDLH